MNNTNFAQKGGRYIDYGSMSMHSIVSAQDAKLKIVDTPLTIIFRRW